MEAQADAQLRRELREIVELTYQAEAQCRECRFARAAKRCAAAVERARVLAALGEDSVVVAKMQSQHARLLLALVRARVLVPTEPSPATGNDLDTRAAAEQALAVLLAAVSAIRNRRVAGTLLRGTCRAAEVTHALAEMDFTVAAGALRAEDVSVGSAEEMGEVAAVKVGSTALFALSICVQPPVQTLLSEALPESSALGVVATYVREMLALVAVITRDCARPGVVAFMQRCEYAIGTLLERVCAHNRDLMAGGTPTQARAASILVEQVKPLCVAWAAQRQTPALQRLLAPDVRAHFERGVSDEVSLHRGYVEAQSKRSCAHCGATEAVRGDFQACSRCRRAFYCSREHQRAHWRAGHKAACGDDRHLMMSASPVTNATD